MKRGGTVYIMTNKNCTVYYVGATSDLLARVMQHKEKKFPQSFTARYNANVLAYFETFFDYQRNDRSRKAIEEIFTNEEAHAH